MPDKLYSEYGNAGHKFPRTTQEAFGPGACVFVATDCDEEDEEITFSMIFGFVVYALAAVVIGVILWGPK